MATPIYEYNADSPELTSQRDSDAVKEDYVDGFSDLVAFEKNTKPVTLSNIIEFTQTTSSIPLRYAEDNFNNRILMGESNSITYTDDEGVTSTTIINWSTFPTTSAWVAAMPAASNRISAMIMLSKTTALVSFGYYTEKYNGQPKGKIFLMTMNAAGVAQTVVEKLSFDYGEPLSIQQGASDGLFVTGMYDLSENGLGQAVFASFDYGENWVNVYNPTYPADTLQEHVHKAEFVDDDTIITTIGDGPKSAFVKLTRPVGWNGSDPWTIEFEKLQGGSLLADFVIDGDKVFIVREGGQEKDGDIYTYDLTTDIFEVVGSVPFVTTNATQYSYTDIGNAGGFTFLKYGSYLFTHIGTQASDIEEGGLYVSGDKGKSWSRIWSGPKGVRYLNGIMGDKIINTDLSNSSKLALFTIPTLRSINAVIAEKAQENVVGVFDGTTGDNWTEASLDDSEVSILVSDLLYASENGILLKAKDNSAAEAGKMIFESEFSQVEGGGNLARVTWPDAGDFVTISMDIKYAGFSDVAAENLKWFQVATFNSGAVVKTDRSRPLGEGWHRVWFQTKCVTPSSSRAIVLTVSTDATPILDLDIEIKIQNVQMYYDAERYDLRTYCPKTITKADDYSIAPLTGLGASWSVTFDWLPLNGNLSFPVDIVATLPIATIKGSGEQYLKLYWDRAAFDGVGGGMAFKLTDGTTTISLDTEQAEAMQWLHNDILKFGITSDGTNTILYCFNPENGEVQGAAILSNTDATTNIDLPTSISLGANDDETIIGTGAFANIRGFNSVLSAGEIEDVFDSVNPLIISGGRYGGGGYRQTLRPRHAGRGR